MSKEQAGLDPELLEKMTSPAGPVRRRRARRGAQARPWPYTRPPARPPRPLPPAAGRHAAGAAAAAAAPAEVAAAALHPRFLPPPAVVERLRRRLRRAGWPPAELQKRQFAVVLLRNAGPAGRGSGSGGSIFFFDDQSIDLDELHPMVPVGQIVPRRVLFSLRKRKIRDQARRTYSYVYCMVFGWFGLSQHQLQPLSN